MNLTEKYRPKNRSEFVGDSTVIEDICECIKNSVPVLLFGPSGMGKTSLLYLISNELNLKVIEINASDERRKPDLQDLQRRLHMRTFSPVIFDIEEVDGLENQDFLAEIIRTSIHPIVLTANEKHKISSKLKKVCKIVEISLKPSQLGLVVKRMKEIAVKEGVKVSYTGASLDIRESINSIFYGADGYEKDKNYYEKIENVFKKGKKEDIPLIWLLDNIHNFYKGKDLYDALNILVKFSLTGEDKLLDCLPKAKKGKATYPYYLKMMKVKDEYSRRIQKDSDSLS